MGEEGGVENVDNSSASQQSGEALDVFDTTTGDQISEEVVLGGGDANNSTADGLNGTQQGDGGGDGVVPGDENSAISEAQPENSTATQGDNLTNNNATWTEGNEAISNNPQDGGDNSNAAEGEEAGGDENHDETPGGNETGGVPEPSTSEQDEGGNDQEEQDFPVPAPVPVPVPAPMTSQPQAAPHDTYVPPDDDPLNNEVDDKVQEQWTDKDKSVVNNAKAQAQAMVHDRNVAIASSVLGVFALVLLLITAQQMMENPDGCCAQLCRCCIAGYRLVCWPCRKLCGCDKRRRGMHSALSRQDDDGYTGYSHDLELT